MAPKLRLLAKKPAAKMPKKRVKKTVCAKKPATKMPEKRVVIVDGQEVDWTTCGDLDPDTIIDSLDEDDSSN